MKVVFVWIFGASTPPQKKGRQHEGLPSGVMVKRHLASKSTINLWGNHTSGQGGFSRAVRRGELLRGKVSQGSTSPLKPCVKG